MNVWGIGFVELLEGEVFFEEDFRSGVLVYQGLLKPLVPILIIYLLHLHPIINMPLLSFYSNSTIEFK